MSEKPLSPDQFVLLIARHERRVRSFIATLTTCRSDVVDEVLQATYLTAWQKLDSFSCYRTPNLCASLPSLCILKKDCVVRFE